MRRPRFQFRLRSLFILTAIVAAAVWARQLLFETLYFLFSVCVGVAVTVVFLFIFLGPIVALLWFVAWTQDPLPKYRPVKWSGTRLIETQPAPVHASPPTE